MKVTDRKPSAALREFVLGYKLIESDGGVVNQLLPDTYMALAFRLRGDVRHRDSARLSALPECTVSGLRSSMREIEYGNGASTLVVQLSAVGASHLFREPLHLFFNQTLALDDIDQFGARELHEQVLAAHALPRQIDVVERFLLDRIKERSDDPVIREAIRRISESCGLVRMRALSSDLCLSLDAFEKRFRKAVGATPKQYASIVRMRAIIEKRPADLAQTTYDFEFYDPAHFSKSFKQFTGKTPTDFFTNPTFW
ncbi:MAG TPA: helix-turn-helix domain-containing protein [Chryseolinea sp.]|nr:helix-turn-helix domain-containing protein [Chryseolinea sp.]